MSNPTWPNALAATLAQARLHLKPLNRSPRVTLLGIGQELRGDDAAGVMVVRALETRRRAERDSREDTPIRFLLSVIDAGAAPENCTGLLRRDTPDLVILIDAAEMDDEPGTVCWLDGAQLEGFSASTHTLPLDLLAHYLETELGCRVALLGIQPADTGFDAPVSPVVQAAIKEIVEVLASELGAAPA